MPPITLKGSGRDQLLASGLLDDLDAQIVPKTPQDDESVAVTINVQPGSLDEFARRFVLDATVVLDTDGDSIADQFVSGRDWAQFEREHSWLHWLRQSSIVGYVFDADDDLETVGDRYVVRSDGPTKKLRQELKRYCPGGGAAYDLEPVRTLYGDLQMVQEDDPALGYFAYYPVLTYEGDNKAVEITSQDDKGKPTGFSYYRVGPYNLTLTDTSLRVPTPEEFEVFKKHNPQYQFRTSPTEEGKFYPVVVKSKIGDHVYKAEEEGLIPFDFAGSTDEELAEVGAWLDARLDKSTGKETAFQITAEGEKKLMLRYPPEALSARIDELQKAVDETPSGIPVRLSDETVFSHATAENLLLALKKVRDGDLWWWDDGLSPGWDNFSAANYFFHHNPVTWAWGTGGELASGAKHFLLEDPVGQLFGYLGLLAAGFGVAVPWATARYQKSKRGALLQAQAQQAAKDAQDEIAKQQDYFKKYGKNLTDEAKGWSEDPALGRDTEIRRMSLILNRPAEILQQPASPLLRGEAGVGKSTMVKSLAYRITHFDQLSAELKSDQIKNLRDYAIIEIELGKINSAGSLVADIPGAVQGIIQQALREYGKVIVFIDEIHGLMKTGNHSTNDQGVIDQFKPAMADGRLKVIGGTTYDEYAYIAKNGATARRFDVIDISEPDADLLRRILVRDSARLKQVYGYEIDPAVIDHLVEQRPRFVEAGLEPSNTSKLLTSLAEWKLLENDSVKPAEKSVVITMEDYGTFMTNHENGLLRNRVDALAAEVKNLLRDLFTKYGEKIEIDPKALKYNEGSESFTEAIGRLQRMKVVLERVIEIKEKGGVIPDDMVDDPQIQKLLKQTKSRALTDDKDSNGSNKKGPSGPTDGPPSDPPAAGAAGGGAAVSADVPDVTEHLEPEEPRPDTPAKREAVQFRLWDQVRDLIPEKGGLTTGGFELPIPKTDSPNLVMREGVNPRVYELYPEGMVGKPLLQAEEPPLPSQKGGQASGAMAVGAGLIALDGAMIYAGVPEKTQSAVNTTVGAGFLAHIMWTNPFHLFLLPVAGAGSSVTHATTEPVVNNFVPDGKDRKFVQNSLDLLGGLGGYAGGAWGLSRLGQIFPSIAALEKAGLALGGSTMTTLSASAALVAAPVLPFLAAGHESQENASLQRQSVEKRLVSKGIDVDHYQQAFIKPIKGTRFRGTVPEYDAQDFETLLLDLFWISVVYREEGESAAMSKLKDVGGEHYMREFSNFKGWQDVHRTDLVILLLRWISILEPELATPIKRDYPVLSSLEVPGDQTVHVPVQQDEIPKITAEDDNVVFIESGPDSEENPALGEVDPALGENSIKGSPAGRSIAGYTSGLFAPGRFVAPVPMAAARVRPVALAI